MAIQAEKGFLPISGGLLDQSAWFLDLRAAMTNEQNKIDAERIEGG